jgi:hypothetical protein
MIAQDRRGDGRSFAAVKAERLGATVDGEPETSARARKQPAA